MMFRRIAGLAALLMAVFCLHPSTPAAAPPQRLVIGLIPEMNVFKQMERFKPLAAYLSEATGIEVQLTILSRYGNLLENFSKEKIDGAFFGSFTGALAIEQLQVTPLARPVNLNGESTYRGLLFVRKDSGISNVAQMRGKRCALVDRATTAGYVFPLACLRQNGAGSLDHFFREHFFAGSHDAAIRAVLDGKADVGAAKNTVYDFERQQNSRIDRELVVLASSKDVPSNALCVRDDLDPALKGRLKSVLLAMDKSARGREVLAKFGAQRFIAMEKADYRPVIDMAAQAGIDLREYRYLNQ